MKTYAEFLDKKTKHDIATGFEPDHINKNLFPFQSDIVKWAIRRGRAALFCDTGLGKTLMQLAWADAISKKTGGDVLILAPLAVSAQTAREGDKFGVECAYAKCADDISKKITITNYERLHNFDSSGFAGVVLDESSILKSFDGKTRNAVIESFDDTPFKLACTATPAPNDFMELGNHSEFLNVMTRSEMLAMYFVHDMATTQKWRLKGHARKRFWEWMCSWSVMIRKPSNLGYSNDGFDLPELRIHSNVVETPSDRALPGMLFPMDALTLQERLAERRATVTQRVHECARIVNATDEHWVVWCNLNSESEQCRKSIPGSVEVRGSDTSEKKEKALLDFASGKIRVLITKPKIAGFGLNWQHCNNVAFVGLSDSFEAYYQAVRRCWRFGQKNPVDVHLITASTEGEVVKNIERKERDANIMANEMIENTQDITRKELKNMRKKTLQNEIAKENGENWEMRLGDCVDEVSKIETESIGYTIFSPPFASLYTYSDSPRDMGNCKTHSEFYRHFEFLVSQLYRVTQPGRLLSFHCMNLPTSKSRDGVIGITDFRGLLIKMFQDAGWIYHSEVTIWKDPVVAMQRTKALGLLYKQLRKDSAMSRNGIPDYLVTMRKPGENKNRISHNTEDFAVSLWQKYASPVWMDINPSRTLQHRSAREHNDEKHICPLQLDVIERAMDLWSKEGDLVLSPFAGIGSEGFVAVKKGRRFIGVELKKSYWNQAVSNLKEASSETSKQIGLFDSLKTKSNAIAKRIG